MGFKIIVIPAQDRATGRDLLKVFKETGMHTAVFTIPPTRADVRLKLCEL